MPSLDRLQLLIEELGPATEEVAEVQQIGEGEWTVFFDDETSVGLDFVPEQEKLVFSAALGAPPAETKAATYELVLIYNFNWPQSGGIKIGLDSPGGSLELLFECHAASLDMPTLQQLLTSFAEKARAWRELVAAGIGGTGEGAAASQEILGEASVLDHLPSAIRV